MFSKPLPRFVIAKRLARRSDGLLFPLACPVSQARLSDSNEPLGTDYVTACGDNGEGGRAAALNGLFDEWNIARKGGQVTTAQRRRLRHVEWLFRQYKASKAYLEKVAPRSRPDYERTMFSCRTSSQRRVIAIGGRQMRTITPVSADKIYEIICNGPRGPRPRQGEKAVPYVGGLGALCTACTPISLIVMFPIPGKALPSIVGPRPPRLPSPVSKSTPSRGAD